MTWKDGWPVIGVDPDGDGIGEPVLTFRKPKTARPSPVAWPQTDDDFDGPLSLGQWNSNPTDDWLSLAARPGRLKSVSGSANLYETGALLSQKPPADSFTATTRLEIKPVRVGEQAGLALFGYDYGWIGLRNTDKGVKLVRVDRLDAVGGGAERVTAALRLSVTPVELAVGDPPEQRQWPSMHRARHARAVFSYSLDGQPSPRWARPSSPSRAAGSAPSSGCSPRRGRHAVQCRHHRRPCRFRDRQSPTPCSASSSTGWAAWPRPASTCPTASSNAGRGRSTG
jgi:hypothetical protein